MILRNFLYLDTVILNDYLSSLEGYIIEESELLEKERKQNDTKAGVKVIEGGHTTEKTIETMQKKSYTDASKFQKLYRLLTDNNMLQFLDAFDDEIWKSMERNEIIEVPVNLSMPDTYKMIKTAGNIMPVIEVFNALGMEGFSSREDEIALKGIKAIDNINSEQHIPIIMKSESTEGYVFTSKLNKKFVRCNLDDLENEVTIIAKIQRKFLKGKKEEVYSMVMGIDKLLEPKNREERRKLKGSKKEQSISDFVDGPGMVLIPIAIFR